MQTDVQPAQLVLPCYQETCVEHVELLHNAISTYFAPTVRSRKQNMALLRFQKANHEFQESTHIQDLTCCSVNKHSVAWLQSSCMLEGCVSCNEDCWKRSSCLKGHIWRQAHQHCMVALHMRSQAPACLPKDVLSCRIDAWLQNACQVLLNCKVSLKRLRYVWDAIFQVLIDRCWGILLCMSKHQHQHKNLRAHKNAFNDIMSMVRYIN